MGILNVTPDSFSDGGLWNSPEKALRHALQMVEDGADIIDVGAESSRPGFVTMPAEEEMERLRPYLELLMKEIPVPSIELPEGFHMHFVNYMVKGICKDCAEHHHIHG